MTHVLIVDDSRLAARVIQRFLGEQNIETLHVSSVADLFGMRGKSPILHNLVPELILLDIYMPEMDGLEVLRKLKARSDVADVPVIMLSSTTDASMIEQSMNLGAEGFIQKPIIPEKVAEELAPSSVMVWITGLDPDRPFDDVHGGLGGVLGDQIAGLAVL